MNLNELLKEYKKERSKNGILHTTTFRYRT